MPAHRSQKPAQNEREAFRGKSPECEKKCPALSDNGKCRHADEEENEEENKNDAGCNNRRPTDRGGWFRPCGDHSRHAGEYFAHWRKTVGKCCGGREANDEGRSGPAQRRWPIQLRAKGAVAPDEPG